MRKRDCFYKEDTVYSIIYEVFLIKKKKMRMYKFVKNIALLFKKEEDLPMGKVYIIP